MGNQTSLTDAEGNTTTWIYDNLGRMARETNELNASRTFEYDAVGHLVKKTDRNGRVTEYIYDEDGQEIAELWKDGASTIRTFSYTYDVAGELLAASDSDGVDTHSEYTYGYDQLGRVISISQSIDGLTPTVIWTQTYDDNGFRTGLDAEIGGTADFSNVYTPDALGRATQITQSGAGVTSKRVDFAYDAAGQWNTITRYADLSATDLVATGTYIYDYAGRLTSLAYRDAQNALLANHEWTFDASGNITAYFNSVDGTVGYTNDSTGQLTEADYSGTPSDEDYAYDDNGNRETANGSTYATGPNNQLLCDGTYTYTYDAEGNRTSRFIWTDANTNGVVDSGEKSQITEYEWDYRNRLVEVRERADEASSTSQVVDYAYDTQNRWIKKTLDSDGASGSDPIVQTVFVYDGNQIALQFEKTGVGDVAAADLAHRYLWGAAVDQLLADEDLTGATPEVLWTLGDHLNTVRDLAVYDSGTDTTTIAAHRVYDSFGNLTSQTSAVDCLFSFTARAFDQDTGLQNNLNRWYEATTGRWVSEDPLGFDAGDVNLQRYVGNQPSAATDPTGLDVVYVRLRGKNLAEVRAALQQLDRRIVGTFTPRFTFTTNVMNETWSAEGCVEFDLKVKFSALPPLYRIPLWVNMSRAPKEDQRLFELWAARIWEHEKGHYAVLQEVVKEFNALPPSHACIEAEGGGQAESRIREIRKEFEQRMISHFVHMLAISDGAYHKLVGAEIAPP